MPGSGFNPYNATARASAIHRGEEVDDYRILEDKDAPPLLIVACTICDNITVTRHPHLLHAQGWEFIIPKLAESWARINGTCPLCNHSSSRLEDLRCNCGEHVTAIPDPELLARAEWMLRAFKGKTRVWCPECARRSDYTTEQAARTRTKNHD
jgi:hypothetical protein